MLRTNKKEASVRKRCGNKPPHNKADQGAKVATAAVPLRVQLAASAAMQASKATLPASYLMALPSSVGLF